MSTFDFAPLYGSTIGFDRLFDLLDTNARPDWPPYNIEKKGDNEYRISMAIAGFSSDEVELIQQGPSLIITGRRRPSRMSARCCTRAWPSAPSSRPSVLPTT